MRGGAGGSRESEVLAGRQGDFGLFCDGEGCPGGFWAEGCCDLPASGSASLLGEDGLWGGLGESIREAVQGWSWEVTLAQSKACSGHAEKWSDSGSILKAEPTGLIQVLGVAYERQEIKDYSRLSGVSSQKDGVGIYRDGEMVGKACWLGSGNHQCNFEHVKYAVSIRYLYLLGFHMPEHVRNPQITAL